mmetsp:Transcript_20799/g.26873  ORF Transcript_20799/g.26873 Transcript_20799/m.26873 type:complete len:145 (+) Transcript_20799:73-507(+)
MIQVLMNLLILALASRHVEVRALAVPNRYDAFHTSKVPSTRLRQYCNCVPQSRMASCSTFLKASGEEEAVDAVDSSTGADEDNALELSDLLGDSRKDTEESPSLYNAVPLFTGTLYLIASLGLTGYGIYAGLTGDDPLAGHPLQ